MANEDGIAEGRATPRAGVPHVVVGVEDMHCVSNGACPVVVVRGRA
jgi:hypothetical protein